MTQTRAEQLEWEARAGRPAGIAAIAAAVLVFLPLVIQGSIGSADEEAESLRLVDDHKAEIIGSAISQAVGLLLLIPVIFYLYRVTRYRRPELHSVALVLGVAGPVLGAVVIVARQLVILDVASEFVSLGITGPRANDRADALVDDSALRTIDVLRFAPGLAVGFALVVLNLNAMRAGVTSRFLGIIGIVVGALYLLGGPPIVQAFWLGALAALFLGRWPGGRGPAWEAGEAVPWPTAADQAREREEQLAEAGSGNGRGTGDAPESADPDVPRPRSRKRKKKKR